jgi:hypothetical protein
VIISGERQELSRRWGSGGSSRKLRRRRDLSKASDRRLGVPQTYISNTFAFPGAPPPAWWRGFNFESAHEFTEQFQEANSKQKQIQNRLCATEKGL